jgi:hypothetical protein
VNQVVSKRMVKHQQMQWTQRGAHMLLQIRTCVLMAFHAPGKCRLFPVTRKAALAASAHSRKRLSASWAHTLTFAAGRAPTFHLLLANSINSRGEIIGVAIDSIDSRDNQTHGFLAIPSNAFET